MAQVEAVLTYQTERFGQEGGVVLIARTADPAVLGVIRDQLLVEARREAEFWLGVDPVVGEIKQAEGDRLARVLECLVPDESPETDSAWWRNRPS